MDDRDLSLWLDFFKQNKADLSLFKIYLKEKDLFFLNNQLDLDYDDENYGIAYPGGFIEKDFQEILKDENNEDRYYNTRLAMVLDSDISIEKIKLYLMLSSTKDFRVRIINSSAIHIKQSQLMIFIL